MTTALLYLFVPMMIIGGDGLIVALARRQGTEPWILLVLAAAIGLSFVVERIIAYEPDWNRSHGDSARDVAHAMVNELANAMSVAMLPVVVGRFALADLWPHRWPFVLQVALAVLVLDFGVTLAHYASHRVAILWRFHAVHHSVRRFYGFNGLMKHPIHQLIELTAGAAPLVVIGLPFDVAVAMAGCVVIQLLLQHSNADYRVGPLRFVLALNAAHRFHHLKWPGVGDVNFGLFTLIWDRLLGTYSFDPARSFSSDDFGIAKWPGYPSDYLEQLMAPFRSPRVFARNSRS